MDKIIDCSYLKRYNRSMDNLNKADGFRSQRIIILPEDILNGLKEDPLASSAYISDIGYFPNAQYHYRERRNGCDAYILIYCGGGEGWYSINGGEKHRVKKGELIIIPQTSRTYTVRQKKAVEHLLAPYERCERTRLF